MVKVKCMRNIQYKLTILLQNNAIFSYHMKMNNLTTGLLLSSIDSASKCLNHRHISVQSSLSKCLRRSLYTSYVLATKKGAGKEEGRMSEEAIRKMVQNEERGVFRKLDLGKPRQWQSQEQFNKRVPKSSVKAPPRETQMKPTQDWGSVWPTHRTFQPSVVPLPIRQGAIQIKDQITPAKYANPELMKIPNFLHLTPPVIKRQCNKLKEFCTPWPEGLENDKDLDTHFPLEEITSDYLNASSSIRDARSRIVTLKFKLSSLKLDYKAQDKFLRLVGTERYSPDTDIVTITSDRCPYRKQNREYCEYLLKVLYHESNKVEEWETEMHQENFDSVTFNLDDNLKDDVSRESYNHMKSLQEIMNQGENHVSLAQYKSAVQNLIGLKNELPVIPENA